ncbi:MAG: hypothetical protein HYZ29_03775 [Myxococcales bacterium]|nr:hypothetical protein [Myxococcales bacterium]
MSPRRLALLALVPVVVLGCSRKDPKKCEEAQGVIRQGIAGSDFAAARSWRDYAYKHCADRSALDALDKEIVQKEGEASARKAQVESERQKTEQLVKLFTEWAGTHKANPAGAAVNVTCTAPADPKKEKERWCTRERTAGDSKLRVTYWEAEPDAFEFATVSAGDVSCELLGGGTQVKNAHGGALLHCNLTGGALAGTGALMIRTAQGTQLSVFSPKYAEKNPAFGRRLNM